MLPIAEYLQIRAQRAAAAEIERRQAGRHEDRRMAGDTTGAETAKDTENRARQAEMVKMVQRSVQADGDDVGR